MAEKKEEIQAFDFKKEKKKTKTKSSGTKKGTKTGNEKQVDSNASNVEAKPEAGKESKTVAPKGVEDFKDPYTYEQLLDRIFEDLKKNNPNLIENKKPKVKRPKLDKKKTKVIWTNFNELCENIKRPQQHVQDFVIADLNTEGTYDKGSGSITLKGKFSEKKIEKIIKNYLNEYVLCQLCKSYDTELRKEQKMREYVLNCKVCQSTRTVTAIRTGYHQITKQERKAHKIAQINIQ